jgi:hypothetical protein
LQNLNNRRITHFSCSFCLYFHITVGLIVESSDKIFVLILSHSHRPDHRLMALTRILLLVALSEEALTRILLLVALSEEVGVSCLLAFISMHSELGQVGCNIYVQLLVQAIKSKTMLVIQLLVF